MTWTLVQAVVGFAMLYFGGESLVRGASALAARLGVSALAIGLTVVAFGTSAPELVVSMDAALAGANDLSVGNVVGSNIVNIALILGIASLIRPSLVEAKVVRIDAPILLLASLVLIGVLADGRMSRIEGAFLLSCLVAYAVFTFWEARRERPAIREEFSSAAPGAPAREFLGPFLVVAGLALLVAGGHILVDSAVDLAAELGVSQALIGLTVVAIGTSLPEFATSVIAAIRGQGDVAIGNVVGSNIFNILGVLGITAIFRPLHIGGITWHDLGAMVAMACALSLMLAVGRGIGRTEGVLLLACFAGSAGRLLAA